MIHFHLPMRICSSICLPPKCGEKLTTLPQGDACHQGGPTTGVIHWGFRIVFGFDFGSGFGFFWGFLSWHQLPCICNSLELESVILHGICYILAWSLCILHGICYIWPCSPSILHGICHILASKPLICMVFATFWYFKRSCFHLGFYLGLHVVFYLGFL